MPVIEAPLTREYGIGKPLEMIMKQAPNAGEEAQRIWQLGQPTTDTPLSPYKTATLEEAVANSYMFIQLSGVKGRGSGSVADVSTGLPWDRQSPMESCAEAIGRSIGGKNHQLRWFSPHKLLVFVEDGQLTPEEMLGRFVQAPLEPYQRELPHLSDVVNQLQSLRALELLQGQKGQDYIGIFNGTRDPLQRGYQDDGGYSFVWGWENRQRELWGVNLDNTPQKMLDLAIDEETNQMLQAKHAFLTQAEDQNRYVVEVDFSATVSCCNISFNAQQSGLVATDASNFINEESVFQNTSLVPYLLFDIYRAKNNCQKCHKNKNDGCSCEKES